MARRGRNIGESAVVAALAQLARKIPNISRRSRLAARSARSPTARAARIALAVVVLVLHYDLPDFTQPATGSHGAIFSPGLFEEVFCLIFKNKAALLLKPLFSGLGLGNAPPEAGVSKQRLPAAALSWCLVRNPRQQHSRCSRRGRLRCCGSRWGGGGRGHLAGFILCFVGLLLLPAVAKEALGWKA